MMLHVMVYHCKYRDKHKMKLFIAQMDRLQHAQLQAAITRFAGAASSF